MSEDEPNVVHVVHLADQVAEAHRAIGHYYVAFSKLIALMREMLAEQVADLDRPARSLADLSLRGLEAMRVVDAFFAPCRLVGGLNDEDLAIEKILRERHVYATITRRNEIAHGDWLIYEWTEANAAAGDVPSLATLVRVVPRDIKEPFKYEDLTAKDIESEANEAEALERMVCEFGCICTKQGDYAPEMPQAGVRVRDSFEKHGRSNHRYVRLRPRNSPELWPQSEQTNSWLALRDPRRGPPIHAQGDRTDGPL
jgi:hypothetical protein